MFARLGRFTNLWIAEPPSENSCGRRSDSLLSLLQSLESEGFSLRSRIDPYNTSPVGKHTFLPDTVFKPLDADRLRFPLELNDFDPSDFLSPMLWIAFVEPKVLHSHGVVKDVASWKWPRPAVADQGQLLKLQRSWAQAGRFMLAESGPAPP